MSVLLALIIGGIVGYIASKGPERSEDLVFLNIIFAVAGSIAGFSSLLLFGISSDSLMSPPSIVASIVGALIAVGIFNGLHYLFESRTKSTTPGGDL